MARLHRSLTMKHLEEVVAKTKLHLVALEGEGSSCLEVEEEVGVVWPFPFLVVEEGVVEDPVHSFDLKKVIYC